MNIVVRKSDGAIVMAASCSAASYDLSLYDVHSLPGWDLSSVDLSGIPAVLPFGSTVYDYLMWNGTTLVRKP